MEWLLLLGFAFFDYIGFNTIGRWNKLAYRVLQNLILLFFLSYVLHAAFGWFAFAGAVWGWLATWCAPFAAGVFIWLWWAFWADLFYYVLYDTLKLFGYASDGEQFFGRQAVDEHDLWGMPEKSAFESEVLGNLVTWAWWTPLGLIIWAATGERERVLSGLELLMQAFIMLGIYGIARALV